MQGVYKIENINNSKKYIYQLKRENGYNEEYHQVRGGTN